MGREQDTRKKTICSLTQSILRTSKLNFATGCATEEQHHQSAGKLKPGKASLPTGEPVIKSPAQDYKCVVTKLFVVKFTEIISEPRLATKESAERLITK